MNDQQLLRYNRQIMLPMIDIEGQQTLLSSTVLVVGVGGLGCPIAMYLAAAGVGRLWLADHDTVELSNLQRQIAHTTHDIGLLKVESAKHTVTALNPETTVTTLAKKLDENDLKELVTQVDAVVDASDNFSIRFALNRACFAAKKPLISGAAIKMQGQVSVFDSRAKASPCYHCLYKESGQEQALTCSEAGILSPVVGIIGTIQATETIKTLINKGQNLQGRLLLVDAFDMTFKTLKLNKDPKCPICS